MVECQYYQAGVNVQRPEENLPQWYWCDHKHSKHSKEDMNSRNTSNPINMPPCGGALPLCTLSAEELKDA